MDLEKNNFNDDDATTFASALKKNTNLLELKIYGNNFTNTGVKTLLKGVFDSRSLNEIAESNHTCYLGILRDVSILQNFIWRLRENQDDKWSKIMMVLQGKDALISYLRDVPVKWMPSVLEMMQAEQGDHISIESARDLTYLTMRWWNMPLMYQCSPSFVAK